MATSVPLGFMLWSDGMEWTSLLQRQLDGGVAVWDAGTSTTAVNPLGGVINGPGSPLLTTQAATPGMSVMVNAGYVAVASLTQGHGVYLFALKTQAALTVAANTSGQTRTDLILARVYDLGNSSSYCDVEIYEGSPGAGQPATPGTSILLAAVSVASGASAITNSNITDKRTYTVAPGGILPATTADAPTLMAGQLVYDTSTGALARAASPVTYTQTWTEPGTYTWTVPASCLPPQLQGWGSGGGGGGYDGSDNDSASGGGGGEYAEEPGWEGLTAGQELVITVPAGGAASGISEAGQTAGAACTITLGAVTILTANGGAAGVNTDGQTVPGGTGSLNTIHFPGGQGGAGDTSQAGAGGGGGGSGGPGAAGQPGQSGNYPYGGQGGAAVPGGGPGGQGGGDYGNGQAPAYGPGGGGGGGSGSDNGSGSGAAGQAAITWTVQPSSLTALASGEADISIVDTSTGGSGSSGLTPGQPGETFGWGIGYGTVSGQDTDGQYAGEIQATFTADGQTDFQIDAKWGLAVPYAALTSPVPSLTRGECQILLLLDDYILDTVCLRCGTAGSTVQPGDAGSWTYYTSALLGTTPQAGTHTVTLTVRTLRTASGESGAAVGNLASTATSTAAFGTIPGYYTTALTQENCYVRVASIAGTAL